MSEPNGNYTPGGWLDLGFSLAFWTPGGGWSLDDNGAFATGGSYVCSDNVKQN